MSNTSSTAFELATWYDTWNETGLNNLINGIVPLSYATRYNLAFASLVPDGGNGYTIGGFGQYAGAVKAQIAAHAPSALVYVGLGSTGFVEAVQDNSQHKNRSTRNIADWLLQNGYDGVSIDVEDSGMSFVAEFVRQIGPVFRAQGFGIAVSVPWPGGGPTELYGSDAVAAFNENVDALEFQDYSSSGTPSDVSPWTDAGVSAGIIMGGVSTENSQYQTSLPDTAAWTQYAMQNGLRGMFSWRLDNDHGTQGQEEDVDPTFTGAKTIYDTVYGVAAR